MFEKRSRREFLDVSAFGALAAGCALTDPPQAAAQSAGIKRGDLPDLTIKEVKVYNIDVSGFHRLNGTETGEILSVVTSGGIEGDYTIGNRAATPGWLEWAKPVLVGKSVTDLLPAITATSAAESELRVRQRDPRRVQRRATRRDRKSRRRARWGARAGLRLGKNRGGGAWPNYYTAAAEVCLWDILGKAVDRPIYKLLGGTKDRVMAYASSQHLATIEDFAPDALKAKEQGFRGYKIHPGGGQHKEGGSIPRYVGHIEEIRQVRKAVGDEFVLAHDPVQGYNLWEALKVGRVLDELGYAWFEDPIRTTDVDGLIELNRALDLPLHVGEFLFSISDFAEYIRRGALDVVRLISDNTGGISGSMRVGLLADAFGLECTPHNWGNPMDLAVHFHLELALPNAAWFEMPFPVEWADRPYHKDRFRIHKDGYVLAPDKPGLGCPLDHDALDPLIKRIDR